MLECEYRHKYFQKQESVCKYQIKVLQNFLGSFKSHEIIFILLNAYNVSYLL